MDMSSVYAAAERLKGIIYKTPLDYSILASSISGTKCYLKLENLQKTGSFKIRGACNKIFSLSREQMDRGVIAASAGNHAQGVAYAASRAGVLSTVVMPTGAPITKVLATKGYGARVELWGKSYDDAYLRAQKIQQQTGATYIHGFDDDLVMAGQGTVALELLDELMDLEAVVVPAGGGGLLAGIAFVLKSLRPSIKVYGVQASGTPSIYMSYQAGELKESANARTIADGISVKRPGKSNFEIIKKYVDDIVLVDDEEIASTILLLLERSKVVAEGAGAAALAALVHGRLSLGQIKVAVIISGGNIDVNVLSTIIERGMVKTGRRLKMRTLIDDRPGSLLRLLALLAELKVNIISISHERYLPQVSIQQAEVELSLETFDRGHIDLILKRLKNEGYMVQF